MVKSFRANYAPGTLGAIATVKKLTVVLPEGASKVHTVAVYRQNPKFEGAQFDRPNAPRTVGTWGLVVGRCGCWRWVPWAILPVWYYQSKA